MPSSSGGKLPVSPVGLAVLGSELVGATVLGVLLDVGFGTLPWCTVGGVLAGLLVMLVHMAQLVRAKPKPPEPKP